jgi:hypothetical protein
MQKDCLGFLKYLNRNGEDLVTFVDESLYISYEKSTWWIDSGATIYVANSLQGFHTRRTLQRGERTIKVANGVQADVEAIGDFTLALLDGFVLRLSLCQNNYLCQKYLPNLCISNLAHNLLLSCHVIFV